jgi:hypothetical protein
MDKTRNEIRDLQRFWPYLTSSLFLDEDCRKMQDVPFRNESLEMSFIDDMVMINAQPPGKDHWGWLRPFAHRTTNGQRWHIFEMKGWK